MWCDLAGSVGPSTCDIFSFLFYLIEVLTWRGTFCWKPHLNRSSGSKVMSIWRVLRTIENNRSSFLFPTISDNQCCWLPTDRTTSQHIYQHFAYGLTICPRQRKWQNKPQISEWKHWLSGGQLAIPRLRLRIVSMLLLPHMNIVICRIICISSEHKLFWNTLKCVKVNNMIVMPWSCEIIYGICVAI